VSRDLTAGVITEITAESLRPVVFYEGEFSTGTLRLWSGVGSIVWDGKTWTGAGTLLAITPIEESTAQRAVGAAVTLSGISSEVISAVLQTARYGKPGRIWLGVLNASGAVIADPYLAFEGKLDVPTVEDSGNVCRVSVSYESRLISLQIPRERRWTDAEQQEDFPGDTGFRYVADLIDKTVTWGGQNYNPYEAKIRAIKSTYRFFR
jgi:hypothetical protein